MPALNPCQGGADLFFVTMKVVVMEEKVAGGMWRDVSDDLRT